jgi:ABC-type glycerol-3-phosphate transport system permease component
VEQILYLLAALLIVLTVGLPLLYMLVSSFKPSVEIFQRPPFFFPKDWSLAGYRDLFGRTNVLLAFRNSVTVVLLSSILGVTLGVGVSYTLTRFRLPGMHLFGYIIFFVYLLPSILLMLPLYNVWIAIGLIEGLIPLSVTYVSITLPLSTWLLRSYFAGIPLDLEEAAMVDGATRLQAFLRITLPLARPGIIATLIFVCVLAWQEVLYATIFASSVDNQVLSSMIAGMLIGEAQTASSFNLLSALGVVATLPMLFFFFVIQRQLVSGFTAGAIKG